MSLLTYFYPRPPRGGRPTTLPSLSGSCNFYPRPPRGGRPGCQLDLFCGVRFLSTPSARRATRSPRRPWRSGKISIHALREEGDLPVKPKRRGDVKFLSTPSARRATAQQRAAAITVADFYPRPPRGGRHGATGIVDPKDNISIHALREEGDTSSGRAGTSMTDFYPRPPRGGRPACLPGLSAQGYFYPRPPRGGRHPQRVEPILFM